MPKFNNLKDMQAYIQENFYRIMNIDSRVERVLQQAMYDAIQTTVYSSFNHVPEVYERREDNGGLSDTRNMMITDVLIDGNSVKIVFENLTEGADSLKGEYIADFIEFGEGHDGKHWGNPNGDWAKPRPFSEDAMNNLKSNPDELIHAIKRNLKAMRFKVK